MRFWRIASLSLTGLGILYITSDLLFDFLGIQLFLLRIPASATMVYGCLCITWGILIWLAFRNKK